MGQKHFIVSCLFSLVFCFFWNFVLPKVKKILCSSKGAYCKDNDFSPYFSTTANVYVDILIALLARCILAMVAPVTVKCTVLNYLCCVFSPLMFQRPQLLVSNTFVALQKIIRYSMTQECLNSSLFLAVYRIVLESTIFYLKGKKESTDWLWYITWFFFEYLKGGISGLALLSVHCLNCV